MYLKFCLGFLLTQPAYSESAHNVIAELQFDFRTIFPAMIKKFFVHLQYNCLISIFY